ncbi:MAG: DUF3108 domain-containing protein [Candidatus Cloacimonas sp.]|nr:DUF3108 domain-containing protein [Candidatus Cloacimonadota bacterium]
MSHLVGFQSGEKLTFDIKYGVITAGQATLEVKEIHFQDQYPAYQITSTAKTNSFFDRIFKVRDNIESILDKKLMVSRRFTKRLNEGRYRQHRIHFYYPDQNFTVYSRYDFNKEKSDEKQMTIPDETQDILSAFYWLRTQKLAPNQQYYVNVTADGRNTNTEILIHPPEILNTIFGKTECLKVEPKLKGEAIFKQTGDIFIWLTNDENRIPVKLESKIIFGNFSANLIKVENATD